MVGEPNDEEGDGAPTIVPIWKFIGDGWNDVSACGGSADAQCSSVDAAAPDVEEKPQEPCGGDLCCCRPLTAVASWATTFTS